MQGGRQVDGKIHKREREGGGTERLCKTTVVVQQCEK